MSIALTRQFEPEMLPAVMRRNWKPFYWLWAAMTLLVLQLLCGTGPIYAILVFMLMVVTYYAVKWAGGLASLFGICIFYLLLQHVLIAQIAKVFFWEPADAPLRRPVETMGVYVIGMASLALGVRAANWMRSRKVPLVPPEIKPRRLLWLSLICTLMSTLVLLVIRTVGTDAETGNAVQGGALGPLKQIAIFGPLAIAAGTAYVIQTSGGRRSLGLINAVPIGIQVLFAVFSASRENSAAPVICYILTCVAFRFRFRPRHYALLIFGILLANFILFPYALVARGSVRTGRIEDNIGRSVDLMQQVLENPLKFRDQIATADSRRQHHFNYFSQSSPTLVRYSTLVVVDGVVDATLNRGTTGTKTIIPGFEMLLPHVLYPDKPFIQQGNFLAHREPGLLPNKKDFATGITLGFFADAFSSFAWLGIAVIPFIIIFCFVTIYRFLINPYIWGNVFALSLVIGCAWGFSEGTIDKQILGTLQIPLASGFGLIVIVLLVDVLDHIIERTAKTIQGESGMTPRVVRVMKRFSHLSRPYPPVEKDSFWRKS